MTAYIPEVLLLRAEEYVAADRAYLDALGRASAAELERLRKARDCAALACATVASSVVGALR
jgi:hypothetical protein